MGQPIIKTTHVCPPIPNRGADWLAYDDRTHPDGAQAYGPTEEAAINSLNGVLLEEAEDAEAEALDTLAILDRMTKNATAGRREELSGEREDAQRALAEARAEIFRLKCELGL